ncbi:MAG: NusG domain II-containing protein [Clostridia bacterium]|nr:NusG domain II-containing protein [Clostridia bacterium]
MKTEKKQIFRDVLLIAVLLIAGLALMLLPKKAGARADIRIDGELYGSYTLNTDRRVDIEKDGAVLGVAVIEDGKVYMESAACGGGDCVKQGAVNRVGQCILCLPQGISIYVMGQGELDGVTG